MIYKVASHKYSDSRQNVNNQTPWILSTRWPRLNISHRLLCSSNVMVSRQMTLTAANQKFTAHLPSGLRKPCPLPISREHSRHRPRGLDERAASLTHLTIVMLRGPTGRRDVEVTLSVPLIWSSMTMEKLTRSGLLKGLNQKRLKIDFRRPR